MQLYSAKIFYVYVFGILFHHLQLQALGDVNSVVFRAIEIANAVDMVSIACTYAIRARMIRK